MCLYHVTVFPVFSEYKHSDSSDVFRKPNILESRLLQTLSTFTLSYNRQTVLFVSPGSAVAVTELRR
jgi:hypothetical protein